MEISANLGEIPRQDSITQIKQEEPETETLLNQSYTEKDIDREIRNLADRKAHGNENPTKNGDFVGTESRLS